MTKQGGILCITRFFYFIFLPPMITYHEKGILIEIAALLQPLANEANDKTGKWGQL